MKRRSYRLIDAKPETRLMSAIVGIVFKDSDLSTEVDGKCLEDAIWGAVDEVPDMVVSLRRKTPVHIPFRDIVERHYGFTDSKMRFYKEIAGQYEISTQTLMSYHNKAMESLRSPSVLDALSKFVKQRR